MPAIQFPHLTAPKRNIKMMLVLEDHATKHTWTYNIENYTKIKSFSRPALVTTGKRVGWFQSQLEMLAKNKIFSLLQQIIHMSLSTAPTACLVCIWAGQAYYWLHFYPSQSMNYEAYPESKDTKVLNMYNIFNLQKRHCEWIVST